MVRCLYATHGRRPRGCSSLDGGNSVGYLRPPVGRRSRDSAPSKTVSRQRGIIRHGRRDRRPGSNDVGGIAADQLRSFIERIERLEEEKANIASDIKDVYAEAKSSGFDTKIMRQIIRIRKMEPHERAEQEELLDLYLSAVGY